MLHDGDKRKEKRPASQREALSVVKKYDLLVFIGRFQPLHKGHQVVIDRALELSNKVLVIVGSAGQARSTRNPMTFEERKLLINRVYPDVIVKPVSDSAYNDTMWVSDVQELVKQTICEDMRLRSIANNKVRVGLIGMEKDHTSYYLKMFPQWDNVPVQQISPIDATLIRKMVFEGPPQRFELDVVVHDAVARWILKSIETPAFKRLKAEYDFIKEYKEKWGEGPHLTADALVEVGGNILLIRRGKEYGHGLYALPGGFLQKNERFEDTMVRELKEETRLKVPKPVLLGSVVSNDVFDRPHRSERGRIITQAYHVRLKNEITLPEVRGSDDAEWAGWVQVSDIVDGTLTQADFFEDHYHIIRKMLGI